LQLKKCTEAELKSVINIVDPITLEDGASVLINAGLTTNPEFAEVPSLIRRIIKFYTIGKYR
jgi:hypothetical protein